MTLSGYESSLSGGRVSNKRTEAKALLADDWLEVGVGVRDHVGHVGRATNLSFCFA